MFILVVEDDYLQAEPLHSRLRTTFPDSTVERISTESEFHLRLEQIISEPPDVIIMDVMLRWADPSPNMPPRPEEVQRGSHQAGLRCERLLASRKETQHVPIILYTILERADLEYAEQALSPNTSYLRKESDFTPLIERIRELTK